HAVDEPEGASVADAGAARLAQLATPDDQVTERHRPARADQKYPEVGIGAPAPDDDSLARAGDRERLLDFERAAACRGAGERDGPGEARAEADLGALRVLDRLAQGALRGIANPIARIGQAVDHLVPRGMAKDRAARLSGRHGGGGRLVVRAGGEHEEWEQGWE